MGEKAAVGIKPSSAEIIRLAWNFQTRLKLSYNDECISSALIQDQSLHYHSLFLHFCDYTWLIAAVVGWLQNDFY